MRVKQAFPSKINQSDSYIRFARLLSSSEQKYVCQQRSIETFREEKRTIQISPRIREEENSYDSQKLKIFVEIFKWRHRYSQISGLHAVVVCLLLGAVVLVVGLVQLAPGATTTDHRLALLVAGSILLLLGEPFFPFSYFVKLYQENAELMPERLVPS